MNSAKEKRMDTEKLWLVGVYIRLSREDGSDQDDSESTINQKKIITQYLDNSFDGKYVLVDFYIDDGLTGTDDTREDFMRLRNDIEKARVNCVICKTLSRAFRNYSDQGYYLEYFFPKQNTRFISISDPQIDTYKNPDAITGLEVPITGIMNDRYAANTSRVVRQTFNMKRRNGEFIGAFAPYGYLKDPVNKNHLIIDPEVCKLKRDMRGWIVHESLSLNAVARQLNDLGIPNPTAYKRKLGWKYSNPNAKENDGFWSPTTVKRLLLDQVNLGHMVQGKQSVVSYKVHDVINIPKDDWIIVKDTHEATFTQEEYDELANILLKDTRAPNASKTVHMFAGMLRCADCHKALHRHKGRGHVYYICRTHRDKSRCSIHSIREDILEKAVFASVRSQIAIVEKLGEMIDSINSRPIVHTQSARVEALLKARKQELMKIKTTTSSLYMDWKTEEITTEEYRFMKGKFDAQTVQTEEIIQNLEEEKRIASNGVTAENPMFTEFLKYRNIERLDRGVLAALVDTILVHEDKALTIRYRHGDQYQRVVEYAQANAENGENSEGN